MIICQNSAQNGYLGFFAQTSKEFLSSNNSIAGFQENTHLQSERYNEVFEEIMDVAEKILQFLSEINAGEEAVNYIQDYIHYRVKYESGSVTKIIWYVFFCF